MEKDLGGNTFGRKWPNFYDFFLKKNSLKIVQTFRIVSLYIEVRTIFLNKNNITKWLPQNTLFAIAVSDRVYPRHTVSSEPLERKFFHFLLFIATS